MLDFLINSDQIICSTHSWTTTAIAVISKVGVGTYMAVKYKLLK